MINKLYGFLTETREEAELYYRYSSMPWCYSKVHTILLPQSDELAYQQYCADQLCLLCQAALPEQLGSMDPSNTYFVPATQVASYSTEFSGVPGNVTAQAFDTLPAYPWVRKTMPISYDGATTVVVDGRSFTWGTAFEVDGIRLFFSGTTGAFTATLNLVRTPYRDILALLAAADTFKEIPWTDTFKELYDTTLPTTKLAAFVLNALANAD